MMLNKIKHLRFHCSQLYKIMTAARDKKAKYGIGETTKAYLLERFVEKKYRRYREFTNKYVEKGLAVEDDAITLYLLVTRSGYHKKNDQRLTNSYITGEVDFWFGEIITEAEKVVDTKAAWDLFTFTKSKYNDTPDQYYWQAQGYMALTGAPVLEIAFCLVNTPPHLIDQAKFYLARDMGVIDNMHDPDYIEACKKIDHSMTFDDIPAEERVAIKTVHRDESAIQQIYDKIDLCRQWMAEEYAADELLTEQTEGGPGGRRTTNTG